MFESFKQIRGKYGYSQARYFDPYIAYEPKGSMTGEIFESYMAFIASLFPYLADKPGSRVIVKADMGPGRFNEMFLSRTSELGMKFFPGLPNGTEVC